MMGAALRGTRHARGWSQERLIRALRDAAEIRGIPIADPSSLKVMISRWENGHAMPDPTHRELLRAAYGLDDVALGFKSTAMINGVWSADLRRETLPIYSAALTPTQIDPAIVDHFRVLLDEFCRLDSLMGPRYVIAPLLSELESLERLCSAARGVVRDNLLTVGARFAELAGWFFQDGGDLQMASYWTNRAMDYAQEIGDLQLISYVLMRKSSVATDGGQRAQGLGIANAALRPWHRLTPGVRALALRQKAYAHAMFDEPNECSSTLLEAESQVLAIGADREEPTFTSYCSVQYVEMEAANCWVRLGRPDEAIETYSNSLAEWPAEQRRDRGLCLSRLASAYASMGEIESACATGQQAAVAVRRAPSARTLGMLRTLSTQVAPSRRIGAVDDLRQSLAGLV